MLSARTIYGEIFDHDEAFGLFCSVAASVEAQGGWENGKIAALVPGSQAGLAAKIARHGADEDKHGRIFTALLRKRGLEPVPVPADTDYTMWLEAAGIGLAHARLRREEELTEADIVTYLAHSRVTEQRASEQMRALRRHAGDRPDIAPAVRVISNDEDNHLAYCHEELLRLAAAGHGEVIRATLRAAALAEITIYRDVSLAVMAHRGRILGWRRPKSAVLAAGIRGVYAYERLGRWRHLAWLYPAATTVVVLATANHFLLDAAAGLVITALGLLATRATARPDATEPEPGGAVPTAASPALGPGAATRHRRPVIRRRLAWRWAWAVTGAAAVLIALRAPAVWADVRAALAHGLRLPYALDAITAPAVLAADYAAAAALPALPRHAHLPRRARLPRSPAAGPPAGEPRAAAGHPVPPATGSSSSSASPVSCPPPPAAGGSPNRAARGCRGALLRAAADARAARPWSAPGRAVRPGIKPASAHPRACPASRTPQTAAGHGASARAPSGPGVTGPTVRHGCGPAPFPARNACRDVIAR